MKVKTDHKEQLEKKLWGFLEEIEEIEPEDRTQLERRLYNELRPMFREESASDVVSDIHVDVMTWRDEVNGNTYHSSQVNILYKGQKDWQQARVLKVPMQYGGSTGMFEQTAAEALSEFLQTPIDYLHRWAREHEIKLSVTETPGKKRACEAWGQ